MTIPVLATKLFIPPPPGGVAPRPRLVDLLLNGFNRKFTLISAPPGFGKTTLLSECIPQVDRPVAWVSLDSGDNDHTRFLVHLISALNRISADIGAHLLEALVSSQPPEMDILLSGLVNQIAEFQEALIIVLDDYHTITNPEVHDILTFLLENQPAEMHLIISSRSDPPWPLARWRSRQDVLEIRTQDLRFTKDETNALLNGIMALGLPSEDVQKLDAKTEGWAAGLMMAALSLVGRENPSGFIHSFTGSHRFIFDYLVEEILEGLPPHIQEFALKTAILDRMCAPLCNALLGIENSQSILQRLEQLNLFILPLDDQRAWYRYHHLFSDLLKSILSSRQPEVVETLHQRASLWYQANGFTFEAVNHAFSVNDVDRVAKLAESDVLGMMERGELGGLIHWLDQLPAGVVDDYPWLSVAQAWALAESGSIIAAAGCLSTVETALEKSADLSVDQKNHLRGHVAAVRCFIEFITLGDSDQASQHAIRALEHLPETDLRTRGKVTVYLGTIQRLQQDLNAALETFNAALCIYRPTNQVNVIVDLFSQIARLRREQGLLHETARVCQEALSLADRSAGGGLRRLPLSAYIMGVLGRVHYEWNQLESALEIGSQALELSKRWGQANTLLGNHLFMGKIYRVQGNFPQALASIQAAREVGGRFSDTHAFVIGTHEAAVRMAMGDMDAVQQWVQQDSEIYDTSTAERWWELAPLLVALYLDKRIDSLDPLLDALENLLDTFESKGVERQVIRASIQKAVVLQAQKSLEPSLNSLEVALTLAEPEGYVRSFIDHGLPMQDLLKKAVAAGIRPVYSRKLLSAVQGEPDRVKSPLKSSGYPQTEALTKRETEVLRLLATDSTIPEIANLLVISTGTLQTHIKRVYRKLGAHSRYEAVTRGKDSGLI